MRVRVIKASIDTYWYADKIGEVFEVDNREYGTTASYRLKDEPRYYLSKYDVIDVDAKEKVVFI